MASQAGGALHIPALSKFDPNVISPVREQDGTPIRDSVQSMIHCITTLLVNRAQCIVSYEGM